MLREARRRCVRRPDPRSIRSIMRLEPLEPRTLLNGLTIITHGATLFGGFGPTDTPQWITDMGTAIYNRLGGNTAIYTIRVEPNGASAVKVTNFAKLQGLAPTQGSASGQVVLLLDWAAASNVSGISGDYSATKIADAVVPYLLNAQGAAGIGWPLVEGAVQIMGHSRGAAVATELAKDLGQAGVWVDQVTLFDPRPVLGDPAVTLRSNVLFADNYYQTDGDGLITPNGFAVSGAYNVGPLSLGGAYGLAGGSTHSDTHLFYHGTIDTSATASADGFTVPATWYPNNGVNRTTTGYYFSLFGGGVSQRPASGVGAAFGGAGSRASVTTSGSLFPNIAQLTTSAATITSGQAFNANFRWNSGSTNSFVQFFLDPDGNPYNNNSVAISALVPMGTTAQAPVAGQMSLLANVAPGTYFLEARINNSTGTRYAYTMPYTVKAAPALPIGSLDAATATQISGWAWDQDTPAGAVNVALKIDGILIGTVKANQTRNDLIAVVGSANHGYTFNVPSNLGTGLHFAEVFGIDTTDGRQKRIGKTTFTTNQLAYAVIDVLNGTSLSGWSFDPNAGATSNEIVYQIDNNTPVRVTASNPRNDLTGAIGSPNHGFSVTLPGMMQGNHTVSVWAVDTTTQERSLTTKRTVAAAAGSPTGSLDLLNATTAAGWVYQASLGGASSTMRIDIDGVAGTPFLADDNRPDLASLGTTALGFNQAIALTTGLHRVEVLVQDGTQWVLMAGRSVSVPVSPLPVPKNTVSVDVVNATTISGWAYATALGGAPVTLRIDIDNLPALTTLASLTRNDLAAVLGGTNFGFSVATPTIEPGAHTLSISMLDPQSLAVTPVLTRSFNT